MNREFNTCHGALLPSLALKNISNKWNRSRLRLQPLAYWSGNKPNMHNGTCFWVDREKHRAICDAPKYSHEQTPLHNKNKRLHNGFTAYLFLQIALSAVHLSQTLIHRRCCLSVILSSASLISFYQKMNKPREVHICSSLFMKRHSPPLGWYISLEKILP